MVYQFAHSNTYRLHSFASPNAALRINSSRFIATMNNSVNMLLAGYLTVPVDRTPPLAHTLT